MFKNYPSIVISAQQIVNKIDSFEGVNLLTDEQAATLGSTLTTDDVTQIAQGVALSADEVEQIVNANVVPPSQIEQIVDTRVGSLVVGDLSRQVIAVGGLNLFNIDDPDVTEGRFVNENNGTLSANAAHNASHFIAVNPGDDLYISNAERYSWYDASQTFVEGFDENRGPKQLVVPEGVSFVRFSVDRPLDDVIVALSDTAVSFEPYVEPLISNTQIAGFSQLQTDVSGLRNEFDQLDDGEFANSIISALFTNSSGSSSPTANLFNIDDPDVMEGFFVNQLNGNLNPNASHISSHFIGVTPGEDLYVSLASRYAFYDSSGAFLEGDFTSRIAHQLVVPENATSFRFSADRTLEQFGQIIVARSDSAVPFAPFQSSTSIGLTAQGQQLFGNNQPTDGNNDQPSVDSASSDNSIVSALFTRTDRTPSPADNLFNIDDPDVTEGRFVNETSGVLNANTSHNASHFIAVIPGEDLYISNAERYVWYDADQNFVSGFDENRGEKQLVVPEGVAFLRFSVDRPLDNVVVARSDTAVPFSPFQSSSSIIGLTAQGQQLLGNGSGNNQQPVDLTALYRLQANLGNSNTWVLPENVLYIGDSFWNNTIDIAAEAIRISGIEGRFNPTSVPGSTLSQIDIVLNGFDLTPFDTIVIGRGTNDQVGGGVDLATYQVRLLTVLGYFVGLGKQIMIANLPPLGHYENYNEAFQASIDEKNDWLDTLFDDDNSSFRIFDINSALDTTQDGRIDDEFAIGGTNIHPNEVGSTAAATALVARWQP